MAQIVCGLATSHSPLVSLTSAQWVERGRHDTLNTKLNRIDGTLVSYEQLLAERGRRFETESSEPFLALQAQTVQCSLDRLTRALASAAPDVVVVIGDDQGELFGMENMPSVSVYYGDEVLMHPLHMGGDADFWGPVLTGYGMEGLNAFPGAPQFALHLINGLIERDVDVAAAASVPDPATRGFGHAFGFVAKRLFGGRPVPMVPILLNTYYTPNAPTPGRCYRIGQALRSAIEQAPHAVRVAVIASGGLSHFLCEPELDQTVLNAIRGRDTATIDALSRAALTSGSSEILNWITAAGALEGLEVDWTEYVPVHRTAAGTGIGMGFMTWQTL